MGFDPGLSASWVTRRRDTSPGRLGPSPMAEKQFRSSWWIASFHQISIHKLSTWLCRSHWHTQKRNRFFLMWFSLQDADVWVSWNNWRINPHDNSRCPRILIVLFVSPINLHCFHIKKSIWYMFLGKHYRANFMDNRHYCTALRSSLCVWLVQRRNHTWDLGGQFHTWGPVTWRTFLVFQATRMQRTRRGGGRFRKNQRICGDILSIHHELGCNQQNWAVELDLSWDVMGI